MHTSIRGNFREPNASKFIQKVNKELLDRCSFFICLFAFENFNIQIKWKTKQREIEWFITLYDLWHFYNAQPKRGLVLVANEDFIYLFIYLFYFILPWAQVRSCLIYFRTSLLKIYVKIKTNFENSTWPHIYTSGNWWGKPNFKIRSPSRLIVNTERRTEQKHNGVLPRNNKVSVAWCA